MTIKRRRKMERKTYRFRFVLMTVGISLLLFFSSCAPPRVSPQPQAHPTQESAIDQGKARYEAADYESARDLFLRATKSEPTNWFAYNWLAWTYYNLGNYEEAVVQFKIANNLKEDASSYQGLGGAYLALADYDSALANFKKYIQMDPQNFYGYNRLGWTYLYLKKYDDAIPQFKIANNLKEDSGSYQGLGEAYSELGRYKSAGTAFSSAIKLAPDDNGKEQAKISLANILVIQGDFQKAYDILGPKPYLGIHIKNAERGIEIIKVTKGSPASLAGLEAGDVLIEFAGRNLKGITAEEFVKKMVRNAEFGSQVKVRIQRNGQPFEKSVSVGITPQMAKIVEARKDTPEPVRNAAHEPGVRWAVIIGISAYADTQIPSLRYASSDARAFYDWAVSPDGGKYAPSRVKLLLNQEATAANIKQALFEWLRKALEEDMVTIYFAGHGSPESPDSHNNLFLLPYDTKYASIATTAFPMWDIETALKRFIMAKKVVVLADACHSGGVGRSFDIARRSNRGIRVNPISSAIQGLSQVGQGVCVISASSDNQFSQESEIWGGGHGVFTYFLLKGLQGDADYNQDRSVSLGELTSYLSEQVRRETQNGQSPTVSGRYDPALTLGK